MLPFLQSSRLKTNCKTWAYVVVPAPWNDDVSILFGGQDEVVKSGFHEFGILLDHASHIPSPLESVPSNSPSQSDVRI
jgi:hypothetical protein